MIKILLVLIAAGLVIGFVVNEQGDKDANIDGSFSVSTQEVEDKEPSKIASEENENEIPAIRDGKTLDLSGQGLTKAPSYIFDETSIQKLDLSDNKLEGSLQAEVRHLQNLKILDLSNNQFTGVPAEVGQLKNLEVLDLSNNQLTGLPYELGNLSNLKILNLKGNAYATADLNIIKQNLPASTVVKVE